MHLIDDGNWDAGDEPTHEDDGAHWPAGPVTADHDRWTWKLWESPDLSEEWPGYKSFLPGPVYVN